MLTTRKIIEIDDKYKAMSAEELLDEIEKLTRNLVRESFDRSYYQDENINALTFARTIARKELLTRLPNTNKD